MNNEPIPYYYDTIDRNAIIVSKKKLFFDWLNSIYPKEEQYSSLVDNNIYLIREMEDYEAILKWLKKNHDKIFMNELNDWYTDEDRWPENRIYKMFTEWFDIEVCSTVMDLEDFPVTKE